MSVPETYAETHFGLVGFPSLFSPWSCSLLPPILRQDSERVFAGLRILSMHTWLPAIALQGTSPTPSVELRAPLQMTLITVKIALLYIIIRIPAHRDCTCTMYLCSDRGRLRFQAQEGKKLRRSRKTN